MAEREGIDFSVLWLGVIALIAILGLFWAARAHHPDMYMVGLGLFAFSVLMAFRCVAWIQDRDWHSGGHD